MTNESANRERYEGKPYVNAMSECLTERGWPTSPVGDRGLRTEVDPSQRDAYESARGLCEEETGYNSELEPLDAAGVAEWYDDLLETAQCLERLGYTPSEPPSQQAFVDTFYSDPSKTWNPYPEPESLAEWASIEEACPQPGTDEQPVQSFD